MSDPIEVPTAPIVSQKAKTVGDENLTPREPTFQVVSEKVSAQVASKPEADRPKVDVHETHVQLDEIITDPSSPLAVQIPDAGRGDSSLPIHLLSGPTPEQVFAAAAKS